MTDKYEKPFILSDNARVGCYMLGGGIVLIVISAVIFWIFRFFVTVQGEWIGYFLWTLFFTGVGFGITGLLLWLVILPIRDLIRSKKNHG
jgi:hypothetical protein